MNNHVREFFNRYGEKEWHRLDRDVYRRITFILHMDFIEEHLHKGARILDAGCGAGRYSIEFAKRGCYVTLFDISDEQLRIAESKIAEAGLSGQISRYVQGDIRDLSAFPDGSFDIVVCYGAPLSYVLQGREKAMQEFNRVLKDGGILAVSVNNKWGVFRDLIGRNPEGFFANPEYWHIDTVIATGDLPEHEKVAHPPRHFFEVGEMKALMEAGLFRDIQLGAAPCILCGQSTRAEEVCKEPTAYKTILDLELRVYRDPGMVGGGEFLLAKGRKQYDTADVRQTQRF